MNVKNIIIFNDFGTVSGGASKVAIDSAIGLSRKGYNVIFLCGTEPVSGILKENNIDAICLHQPEMLRDKNKLRAAVRSIWNQKAYKTTRTLLKDYNTSDTIIVVHGYAKTLSTSIFVACNDLKFKMVLILHDYFAACPNGGFFDYQERCICKLRPMSKDCVMQNCDSRSYLQKIYRCIRQYFIRRRFLETGSRIYAYNVSDFSGNRMQPYIKRYFARYETLHNPVDLNTVGYVDITRNNAYIFVGRLSEEKGIKEFCKVMTELSLHGIVLGDGYLMDELRKAYPNILFVGWADAETKDKYLRQAKCLIFPSKVQETFGLSIAEALSYGIPCIMPDECGASCLIKDGENGYLYPMNNYDELKQRVQLIEQCDITQLMDSIRKSFTLQDFTLSNYIDKMEKIFTSI